MMVGVPDTVAMATTPRDYDAFAGLVREYVRWLHERYSDVPGLINGVSSHQALDNELENLATIYGPPQGRALLARRTGEITGCVAYHSLHDGSCEMKRLFVPERYQGHGTGRALCEALIAAAISDGYRLLRLDTGFLNSEALAMYGSMGFRECPPYRDYPEDLAVHLRFMEINLTSAPGVTPTSG
jgi:GNAT superfamily N-acetyltransferase